jgi:hydroxymethylpyrimidine pyrophosphatase-like HAD family hydrolase
VTGEPATAPKLVATDLDGTLLDAEGRVTERTRAVLDELDRRGVPVVFVTGRPIRWMESLWDAVGGHGLAVCSNGGIVYDVARHAVRTALTIDPGVASRVGRELKQSLPGTSFALEKTTGFAREPEFMPRVPPPDDVPVGALEEILDDTVVKLLARHEAYPPEEFWARVEELVGSLVTTTWSTVGTLVEMSAHGVTKASTLERLCHELGVARAEVVAFGDMPNDVAMLQWAGRSYAMDGAHPSVQAVATDRAPAHDLDGVAQVLTGLFDL